MNNYGEVIDEKKGLLLLSILFLIEVIFFIRIKQVLPANIISWDGTFRWSILLYWIFHITVVFIIFTVFFLKTRKVNYLHLLGILFIFLVLRIIYDTWLGVYVGDKPNTFYFEIARVCFYAEIALAAILYMLFFVFSCKRGYHYAIHKQTYVKTVMLLLGIFICIGCGHFIISEVGYSELNSGRDGISLVSVLTVFMFNLILENIISLFMFLLILSNFKPLCKGECSNLDKQQK